MSAVLPIVTENLSQVYAVIKELERKVNCLEEKVSEQAKTITDQAELIANLAQRITTSEKIFFKHDEEGDIIRDEEDHPILSMSLSCACSEPAQNETEPVIPLKTTLEKKAVAFAEWLFKKPYSPTGVIQADDNEIKEFINEELDEKLRGKDKSDRKIKMRIINKAKELYPGKIEINKNPNGRHKTSVFVKNSFQQKRTVRTPLFLGGELI